jgi:hypothetical protein
MRFHLPLPTVKTAAFYQVPIKNYSKNTHAHLSLKWTLGCNFYPSKAIGTL